MNDVFKPSRVAIHKSLVHSIEDHNFWIDRNKVCPYCMSGSKPVQKVLVEEGELKNGTY